MGNHADGLQLILEAIRSELDRLEGFSIWPVGPGAITPLQGPIRRIREQLGILEARGDTVISSSLGRLPG